MTRNSTERVSEEEKLMNELGEKLAAISPLFVEGRNIEKVIETCEWYAEEKMKVFGGLL
jgi:hypothetical protein